MRDELEVARALLPGVRLGHPESLGGSDRSEVRRVRARWPDQDETTVVVKSFVSAGEGWVREAAALEILPGSAPAPRMIAESSAPPTVIMADLGTGGSVADALLGQDADAAAAAVARWAAAIAALHRETLGLRAEFRAAISRRAGDLPVSHAPLSAEVDEAVGRLEDLCGRLDVTEPPGALAELRELPRRIGVDGPAALSPADGCPDNNLHVGDGLALVDFEGAQWRHIAWDVAYLSVPWPSCWCSWRMPGDVAERALERYRATIEDVLPYVRTADFRRDVTAAAAGWSLVSSAWYLPNALADDPPSPHPDKPTPTRRAMILHRLDRARRCDEQCGLPALAELAERLRARLVQRWGEVPLGYARAFEDS